MHLCIVYRKYQMGIGSCESQLFDHAKAESPPAEAVRKRRHLPIQRYRLTATRIVALAWIVFLWYSHGSYSYIRGLVTDYST